MNIKFQLTEDDYVQFNLFHFQNSSMAKKTLLIQRLIGPVIFFISIFFFSKVLNLSFWPLFIMFSVLSILWFLFYPKYFYHVITKQTKKMIYEGQNKGLIGEHKVVFTEEGIEDHTETGVHQILWSGIQQMKENDHYLYLYNTAVSALIIPKRRLANPNEIRSFIESCIQKHQRNESNL